MLLLKALILGLIQGLTEFIPVSSSGHLIIAQNLLGVQELGLAFDVALHIGTLFALVVIFKGDLKEIDDKFFGKSKDRRLFWLLVIGLIPAVIAGLFLEDIVKGLRSNNFVAVNLILIAVVMLLAEWHYKRTQHKKDLERLSSSSALSIGFAQALALFPGVSRSGATITAGLFNRLDRVTAARFSFLLAIPITFAAAGKVLITSEGINAIAAQPAVFAVGIVSAFFSGLIAIKFLLKFLSNHGLNIFAYYRIIIGLLILFFL